MKIRTGFVSNSSSSSFLILGTSDSMICKAIAKAIDIPNGRDDLWEFMEKYAGRCFGTIRHPTIEDLEIFVDNYDGSIVHVGMLIGRDGAEIDLPKDTTEWRQKAANMIGKAAGFNNFRDARLIYGEWSND